MSSMQATDRHHDEVTILKVVGPLRLDDGVERFRALIAAVVLRGQSKIVLDLRDCMHMDSAGLGALATALVKARKVGGQLVLLHVSGRVRELLRITGLASVFALEADEISAIASAHRR